MTTNHPILDVAAGTTIIASLVGVLPAVAALLGVVYYLIQIWVQWPQLRDEWRRRYRSK